MSREGFSKENYSGSNVLERLFGIHSEKKDTTPKIPQNFNDLIQTLESNAALQKSWYSFIKSETARDPNWKILDADVSTYIAPFILSGKECNESDFRSIIARLPTKYSAASIRTTPIEDVVLSYIKMHCPTIKDVISLASKFGTNNYKRKPYLKLGFDELYYKAPQDFTLDNLMSELNDFDTKQYRSNKDTFKLKCIQHFLYTFRRPSKSLDKKSISAAASSTNTQPTLNAKDLTKILEIIYEISNKADGLSENKKYQQKTTLNIFYALVTQALNLKKDDKEVDINDDRHAIMLSLANKAEWIKRMKEEGPAREALELAVERLKEQLKLAPAPATPPQPTQKIYKDTPESPPPQTWAEMISCYGCGVEPDVCQTIEAAMNAPFSFVKSLFEETKDIKKEKLPNPYEGGERGRTL